MGGQLVILALEILAGCTVVVVFVLSLLDHILDWVIHRNDARWIEPTAHDVEPTPSGMIHHNTCWCKRKAQS